MEKSKRMSKGKIIAITIWGVMFFSAVIFVEVNFSPIRIIFKSTYKVSYELGYQLGYKLGESTAK